MTNGTILRKLRERKHLSQKEIAEKLDVAQSTYSQWESDFSTYKVDMLPKLAEVFEVDVTELIPKGTTVKIVNNSNNNDGSVNAIQVQMDARKLHNDLFNSYESIIKAKDEIIESKKEMIAMLKEELTKLKGYKNLPRS